MTYISRRLLTSSGKVKVIIAPHDAHALRGSNNVPCDAYCKKLNGAFLDFYSLDECVSIVNSIGCGR